MKKYSEKKIKKFIVDLLEEKKPISKNNKINLTKMKKNKTK